MTVLGIDPGATGAVALMRNGNAVCVWDVPTIRPLGSTRPRVDEAAMVDLVAAIVAIFDPELAIIEEVGGWGAQRGQFAFGYSTGCITTAVKVACIPLKTIRPQDWKAALNIPKVKGQTKPQKKEAARLHASKLMPAHHHLWPRKKDHDRAEAALLAYYGHHHVRSYHSDGPAIRVPSRRRAMAGKRTARPAARRRHGDRQDSAGNCRV